MSPQSEQTKAKARELAKESREKWTFYLAIARTILAITTLAITITSSNGGSFVLLL